jgi:hypothetical protein
MCSLLADMFTPRLSVTILSTIFGGALLSAGCSSASDPSIDGQEGNLTPDNAATVFDQATVCNEHLEDRKAFRDADIKDGVLRWKCGDVKGVTINRDKAGTLVENPATGNVSDLGQEYCEYHAVADGKIVDFAEDLKKLQPTTKLSCVFTGVFKDVLEPSGGISETNALDAKVATDVAASLGSPSVDPKVVRMHDDTNTRGAASQLISDCFNWAHIKDGKDVVLDFFHIAPSKLLDARRQAACIELALKSGQLDKSIASLCRGVDLSDDSNWQKVVDKGGKVVTDADAAINPEGFERQKDIAACATTFYLKKTLVTWRNSDPSICARTIRAVQDCGDTFLASANVLQGAVPNDVPGFLMTGWEGHKLPDGCRRAVVGGKGSDQIVICDVNQDKVKEAISSIDVAPVDPQVDFCHDLFANNIAMQAPMRALTLTKGTSTSAFCAAYNNGQ